MAYDDKNAFHKNKGRVLTADEIVQGAVNAAQNAIRVENTPPTTATAATAAAIAAIDAAPDKIMNFTYLDAGSAVDRRIDEIETESPSLGLLYLDTFTYGGSSGGYYITAITRS